MPGNAIYEFGVFRLDARERLVTRGGMPVSLAPKVFDTLLALVESSGHLVTKEELMKRVWPDAFVEEGNLAQNISAIRRALADGHGKGQYVETVPKIGYRFTKPVQLREPEPRRPGQPSVYSVTAPHPPVRTMMPLRTIGLIVAGLTITAFLFTYASRDDVFRRSARPTQTSPTTIGSIAVLPFANLSSDPEQEYFSDGMTDELITNLAKLTKLPVISHTSVVRYKQTKEPLPQIARELGVDAVVEGSVMRSAGRVRITAQLIDTRTDRHLWAESYERNLQDALAIQSEVAERIADEVGVKLTPNRRDRLAGARPASAEAHEAYLKGEFYWNRLNCPAFDKALEYFQQAVALDTAYAAAYAGLARTHFVLADFGCRPQNQQFEESRRAALKAIESDPALGSPHVWLGKVHNVYDWDWHNADMEFRRAAELDPNDPEAHLARAVFLIAQGGQDAGFAELKRAQELDPTAELTNVIGIYALYLAHHFDDAIQQARKTLELYPSSSAAYFWLAANYERKSNYANAVAAYIQSKQLSGTKQQDAARWQLAFQRSGIRGYWEEELKQATRNSDACWITMIYAHLGDKERTLQSLQRGIGNHCRGLNVLKVDPVFDSVRDDARFQEILRRLQL